MLLFYYVKKEEVNFLLIEKKLENISVLTLASEQLRCDADALLHEINYILIPPLSSPSHPLPLTLSLPYLPPSLTLSPFHLFLPHSLSLPSISSSLSFSLTHSLSLPSLPPSLPPSLSPSLTLSHPS